MVKAKRVGTRTAVDWEDAALNMIAASGLRALSIPELARTLGVTKGSFYWHFPALGALIDAALKRWEELDREALEELRHVVDPRSRLVALFHQSMEKTQAHALFVRLSASDRTEVATILRRISARRLKFLIDAYRELGLRVREAREQALLAYAAYLGALQLRQQRSTGLRKERDLAAYVAHAVKTLIPGENIRAAQSS